MPPTKRDKKVKRERKPKEPMEHWASIVHCYSEFVFVKYGERPTFSGSFFRDLRNIVEVLKKRCLKKGCEWNEIEAMNRLSMFLEAAYQSSEWLRENFIPFILYRHIDSIFFFAAKFRHV